MDIQHFKLYNELFGTEKGDALLETVANCLLGYSKQTGYPVGYFGNDDFFLCLPDEKAEQTAVCLPRCRPAWLPEGRMSPSLW